MESLQGYVLAAAPQLRDANFARTVVLVLQHGEQGALGVVLNRPLSETVQELWSKISEKPCPVSMPVHFGGPVPGPLMAIHASRQAGETKAQTAAGVFIAADREHIEKLLARSDASLRVFVGHAGWAPGQLEHELARGDWLVVRAQPDYIFFSGDADPWREIVRSVGRAFCRAVLGVKRIPADVSCN